MVIAGDDLVLDLAATDELRVGLRQERLQETEMSHPLRANLEIAILDGTEWVRCSKCQRKHCRAGEDWRAVL